MDAVKEYNCAMFARILGYKWAFWKFSSIQTLTNAKDDNKYFPFPSKNLAPPNSKKAVFPENNAFNGTSFWHCQKSTQSL